MTRIVQDSDRREQVMTVVKQGLNEVETMAQSVRGSREEGLDLLIRNPDVPIPNLDQGIHLRIEQTITSTVQSVARFMTPEEREALIKEIRQAGKPGRM
jgi:hypothetical protein